MNTAIQPVVMFNVTLFGQTRLCTEAELIAIREQIDSCLHVGEATIRRLILCAVATHFNVSLEEMMGRRRQERFSIPRQVAMTLFRDMTEDSLEFIGKHFNRDHGTVLYAWRQVHGRADVDERFRKDFETIKKAINQMVEESKKQLKKGTQ